MKVFDYVILLVWEYDIIVVTVMVRVLDLNPANSGSNLLLMASKFLPISACLTLQF